MWKRIPRSAVLFGLKIGGAGCAFITNVVVARLVSPGAAGVYFGLLSGVTLLYAISRFGLGYSTAKLVAAADSSSDYKSVGATMFESVRMVFHFSVAVTLLACSSFFLFFYFGFIQFPLTVSLLMILSIAPFSIGSIVMEGVRGLRRSLEFGTLDSIVFKFIIVVALVIFGSAFGLIGLAVGYLSATIINALIARAMFKRVYAEGINSRSSDPKQAATLRLITRQLGVVSIATVMVQWAPTLIVSQILAAADAAVYFAAFRTAAILEFIVTATIVVVGPELVHAANLHGLEAMRRAAGKAALGALAGTAILAIPIFIFSSLIMSLFGARYVIGSDVLRVLVVGQLVASPLSFGLPALIAASYERRAAIASAAAATTGVGAILVGTSLGGTVGAAMGQAFAVIVMAATFSVCAFVVKPQDRA